MFPLSFLPTVQDDYRAHIRGMTGTLQITSPRWYNPPPSNLRVTSRFKKYTNSLTLRAVPSAVIFKKCSTQLLQTTNGDSQTSKIRRLAPKFSPEIEYFMQHRRTFINAVTISKHYLTRNSSRIFLSVA
jgi:hypothetical protein